jgi:hypothetical protein
MNWAFIDQRQVSLHIFVLAFSLGAKRQHLNSSSLSKKKRKEENTSIQVNACFFLPTMAIIYVLMAVSTWLV